MRVLVVATSPQWNAGTRLMASLAAGLSARGDVVAIACAPHSAAEAAIERTWPRMSLRTVTGQGWFRQGMSLRAIVTALRPDALLVSGEADAVLAAFAMGKRGGIVRRYTTDEREGMTLADAHDALPWRARYTLSRASITAWGASSLALGWPMVDPLPEMDGATSVHRLPVVAPHIVLVPAATHDEVTANALRAIAHVRSRHGELRISLLGEASALQATRLHAAALDLSGCVQVVPLDTLLHHEFRGPHEHASVAWIAAGGDAGAPATLAAMQQGIPVVVPQEAAFAELVTPGVTGFRVPGDSSVTVVAEVARVLSDASAQRAMGEAAALRAAREYAWDSFVDMAATLLAQAGGVAGARVTSRPSLTPA